MGTKHKHYDVIVAWAAGEEVQWRPNPETEWIDLSCENPSFFNNYEYRIKPQRVKKEGWVNVYPNEEVSCCVYPSKESADHYAGIKRKACIRIEWEEESV